MARHQRNVALARGSSVAQHHGIGMSSVAWRRSGMRAVQNKRGSINAWHLAAKRAASISAAWRRHVLRNHGGGIKTLASKTWRVAASYRNQQQR